MSDFVTRNKPLWDELEALVQKGRKWTKRLTSAEQSRLDILYRRTTVHLSQAASRTTDARLIRYLNDLTAAAHSLIYLPPKQSPGKGALLFLTEGFGRRMARQWRFHAVSAVLLLGGALLAYWAALSDPLAAYALSMPGDPRVPGSTREQLLTYLRSGREGGAGEKFFFASFLFQNNLKVGLVALGLGVLAAVPTIFLMIYNGMVIGGFVAVHHQAGIYGEMWAWILPHGITELGAIIICGGLGLMMGHAAIAPAKLSRGESIRRAGIDVGTTCLGVAVMLVLAAIIESYLRQSQLSTEARLVFAALTAVFWSLYIANGFRRERVVRSESAQVPAEFEYTG